MNKAFQVVQYDSYEARSHKLDEEGPISLAMWFVFGVQPDTGKVDISTPQGVDIFTRVPPEKADKIVALRDKFLTDLALLIREDDGTRTE